MKRKRKTDCHVGAIQQLEDLFIQLWCAQYSYRKSQLIQHRPALGGQSEATPEPIQCSGSELCMTHFT